MVFAIGLKRIIAILHAEEIKDRGIGKGSVKACADHCCLRSGEDADIVRIRAKISRCLLSRGSKIIELGEGGIGLVAEEREVARNPKVKHLERKACCACGPITSEAQV